MAATEAIFLPRPTTVTAADALEAATKANYNGRSRELALLTPLILPFPVSAMALGPALGPALALARLCQERAAVPVVQGNAVAVLEERPEGPLTARLDGEVHRGPLDPALTAVAARRDDADVRVRATLQQRDFQGFRRYRTPAREGPGRIPTRVRGRGGGMW